MNINQQQLKDALSERYLAYALSTITARSLPDLRDGLKPVHRRLIHAMAELKLNPETGFKKCARIVGDVMGKYHPHGDASIYDAMVRMAQEFSLRYPLVDGQGNFGNIDGDNAAAMRYTEARMTKFSEWMLQDINRGTVDFRPTYDGEGQEPELLPAGFPNLLANGAQGIAVGMATNIPPHNIHELCDALLMLLDNPQQSVISLLRVIKGPDFPTGGVMVENTEETINAYRTGKGSFRLRARWQVEVHKGGAYQIAITEIPFQVQKSKLIEKIAELIQNRKLPLIGDIRDESAEDIRIVIHPKNRAVEASHIMSLLFKQTDLETKFSMNMNVLDKGQIPKVMPLTEVLNKWLEHRREVMLRANQYRLQEIAARLEILAAYLIAYRNLDMVIKLIREQDDAKQALMKHLKIPENYADTILAMRLRQLHKLEEGSITKENLKLRQEQKDIGALLASDALQDEALKKQITELKNKCDAPRDKRLTSIEKITLAEEVIPEDLLTEKEPLTIIYSDKDWIKMAKTHLAADHPHRFKDGDALRFLIHCHSTDQLQFLTSYGKSYSLPASKITSARGFGEPLRLLLDIEANERIIACNTHNDQQKWLLVNNYGLGFVVSGDKLKAQTRSGRQVMVLKEGGAKACQVTHCLPLTPEQNRVAVLSDDRKLLLFDIAEIPELARGQGVILQKYKGSYMADIQLFNAEQGPRYQKAGQAKNIADYQAWLGKRGQVGKLPPAGFPHKASF